MEDGLGRLRIKHTGITVSNLETSLEFYCGVLGLEQTFYKERSEAWIGELVGYPGAKLKIAYAGGIELLEYVYPFATPHNPGTAAPGAAHVCFEVSDVDHWVKKLQDRLVGYAIIPDGPNEGAKAAYFRDPDGFTLEFFQA